MRFFVVSEPMKASGLVALSAILYGFLGYLGTRVLDQSMHINTMLFWRFIIAAGWLSLFCLKNTFLKPAPSFRNWEVVMMMFLLGAVGYAGSSGFYFVASQYTGTGLAMVIFFSYPVLVALISWLLRQQKLDYKLLIILAIMMIGLILLNDSSAPHMSLVGIIAGLMAATCYAFYVVGSKHFSTQMDATFLALVVSMGSAAIFLSLSLAAGEFFIPYEMKTWIDLLALGILATAIPIQLMLQGLKLISSLKASIISVLEPLVTLMVGIIFLHEGFTLWQALGGVLLLMGAMAAQYQS